MTDLIHPHIFRNFNSTLVRLRPTNLYIGSGASANFNSTLVRLRQPLPQKTTASVRNFNSTLVRLRHRRNLN